MANSTSKKTVKIGRSLASGRYATVGRTSDGVTVLQPSKASNHFTAKEARNAVIARIEQTNPK
jgi:hypothetical protein